MNGLRERVQMEMVRLGGTDLTVTRLGLGGVQLAKITNEEAVRVVRTGLDAGVTFLETARGYWDSEEKMGRAVTGRRDDVTIASKASASTADEMLKKIDESLQALNTDRVDLYQYHGCDTREAYDQMRKPGGALEGLLRAKEAGKIRAFGFSSHQLDLALDIINDGLFPSAQLPISFMNVENQARGLFETAARNNVGLIAMKPFGGGRLGNARLCMGYVLSLPDVVAAVGVDRVDHVRELASLAAHPPVLTDEDRAGMERIREEVGTRFCRACNYCQPCPENIGIASVLWTPVYLAQMGPDRVLTKEGIQRVRDAEKCTECRECEARCPFDLDIVEGLKHCRALVEHALATHQPQDQ